MIHSEKKQIIKSLTILFISIVGMAFLSYLVFYQLSKAAIKQKNYSELILNWADSSGISSDTLKLLVSELKLKNLEKAVIVSIQDSISERAALLFVENLSSDDEIVSYFYHKFGVNDIINIRNKIFENRNLLPMIFPVIKEEMLKSLENQNLNL